MGGSLFELLKQDRRLPEPVVCDFGLGLAAALQYCHSKVHHSLDVLERPCWKQGRGLPEPMMRDRARPCSGSAAPPLQGGLCPSSQRKAAWQRSAPDAVPAAARHCSQQCRTRRIARAACLPTCTAGFLLEKHFVFDHEPRIELFSGEHDNSNVTTEFLCWLLQSLIYSDMKPSNLLLDENGCIKLGGFGLSRNLHDINTAPPSQQPPVCALLCWMQADWQLVTLLTAEVLDVMLQL